MEENRQKFEENQEITFDFCNEKQKKNRQLLFFHLICPIFFESDSPAPIQPWSAPVAKNRSVGGRDADAATGRGVDVVGEVHQNPNPSLHPHPRRDHRDPSFRQGERVHGKAGRHVHSMSAGDFPGGDVHEADLSAGVENLERTIVVGKSGVVGVPHGRVLRVVEARRAVDGRKPLELDGGDVDLGGPRPE